MRVPLWGWNLAYYVSSVFWRRRGARNPRRLKTCGLGVGGGLADCSSELEQECPSSCWSGKRGWEVSAKHTGGAAWICTPCAAAGPGPSGRWGTSSTRIPLLPAFIFIHHLSMYTLVAYAHVCSPLDSHSSGTESILSSCPPPQHVWVMGCCSVNVLLKK